MSLFFCTKESENESTIYSLIIMTQIVIQLALSAKLSFTAKRFMSKTCLIHIANILRLPKLLKVILILESEMHGQSAQNRTKICVFMLLFSRSIIIDRKVKNIAEERFYEKSVATDKIYSKKRSTIYNN